MFDHTIAEACIKKDCVQNFWKAIDIYLFKTHVVNKKLFGVKNVAIVSFTKGSDSEVSWHNILDETIETTPDSFEDKTRTILANHGCKIVDGKPSITSIDHVSQYDHDGAIVLNRLLPKNISIFHPIDVVCWIDFRSYRVLLQCLQKDKVTSLFPTFPFSLEISQEQLSIRCRSSDTTDERSIYWLREVLLERMQKWMESSIPTDSTGTSTASIRSLALVDNLEEYNCLFNELKQKYGLSMVSIWPECTDPQKFVFEDIAIAAYLLMLWKKERTANGTEHLQSFVDIGCGNGLLVYILASEGHRGYGIDLRKRKLWDLYPTELKIDLRVETIVPSNASLFPDIDWIIGNHSDELSPWIPVIAARSSYRCRFFLLPCCAYEFDGRKYQRQNGALSQYGDFLTYAVEIARVCGFHVETDRLRIPSTKRTCLVGIQRIYLEAEYERHDEKIRAFISERSKGNEVNDTLTPAVTEDSWSANFKPRESVEKVRNCTKIDRSVVEKIVSIVFEELLAKRRIPDEFSGRNWNAGGTITLEALVKAIPQEYLVALKAECGGLQTLLRNNHQIFRVEKGTVQLRIPTKVSDTLDEALVTKMKKVKNFKPINFKQRLCWFFTNHPDGCPLVESECKFNHGTYSLPTGRQHAGKSEHRVEHTMVEIKSFVFFDLETTGIPHLEHFRTKITELSMVACAREHLLESSTELPRVTHKLSLCFNPLRMITLGSSQATGLYNDLLEKESKFDANAGEMVKLYLERLQKPICLVAHNGNRFDFVLLKQHMLRIGVLLPADLYCVDSLPAFRQIESDVERSYFEHNEGLDSEIPELEYQALRVMEELEQANDWLKERQKINENTPHSGRMEQKYKQALREYLSVAPGHRYPPTQEPSDNDDDDNDGDNSDSQRGAITSRKRLFSETCFDDMVDVKPLPSSQPVSEAKKRYNLSDLYKRTVGKDLINAHRAEDDTLALMNCTIVHGARFVRYAEANCVAYEEVKSKF
uniref:Probable tRNA (uracil-O(2)-)-methyltransferase n=1 Tax=Anopheles minimus TaxID=112268 RepID=A0A182WBK6_9DIPT